jgi:predicted enzyme related to lactoylglutathione lyase
VAKAVGVGCVAGRLETAGVRIAAKREDFSDGRFAWIWDPEGNRVELWQPARLRPHHST